ncbi:MAG: hypothetical protein GW859_06870 [Sphingomonadales bacterium]|nr:hypothetical protein [Sphingomonadales bacterium]
MHKIVLAAALTGAALALAACSKTEEATDSAAATDAAAESPDAPAADTGSVLDANTATAEQLAAVDNVSPELAKAIVAGRPYASVTELNAALLAAATPEQAAATLARVFVPVNLNSASRDEIALIPGMTDRMIHEFEEYRPYEDMAEFDREIGKYVDEAEVARFRNYVTL